MLSGPGPALDAEVARLLGASSPDVLPYSTDPRAADRLVERLRAARIFPECKRSGRLFYCTLSIEISTTRERVATGTGPTRPLALCLAVLNLPEGTFLNRIKR